MNAPTTTPAIKPFTRKDLQTDRDVRWCPGCGDYAILATIQKTLPELGIAKENIAFISGIGCSSRFPYYVNTYGMHSIHGRAPTIATGLKLARPELSVWVVTGDGDGLSIGGNHMLHVLRRNVDLNVLLFNNQIYGLTKGQYSPTSPEGLTSKSTPYGSVDHPVNPVTFALGSGATFVARTIDTDVKHMAQTFKDAEAHRGTSLVEIYQTCVVFNDDAFVHIRDKKDRAAKVMHVVHGQPFTYDGGKKGLALNPATFAPVVVDLEESPEAADTLLVHDSGADGASAKSAFIAQLLATMGGVDENGTPYPVPVGIFHQEAKPTYDGAVVDQLERVIAKEGQGTLDELFSGGDTWVVD